MANNFFIVPSRLVSGSEGSSGVVSSLNGLVDDISLNGSNGLQVTLGNQSITLSLVSGTFVLKTGDTYTGNLLFRPSNGGFGLGLMTSTTDPIPANSVIGGLYFNPTTPSVRINTSSGWMDVASLGGGLTQTTADSRYLKLDTSNGPLTGDLRLGSGKLGLGNKSSDPGTGNPGDIYFNTTTNTARIYNTASGWLTVGGISQIVAGNGLTGGTITTSGTIAIDVSYSPVWTGNHSFTRPITFANNQSFPLNNLTISGQTNGDLAYYSNGWTRFPLGNNSQVLTIVNGAVSWQNSVGGTQIPLGNGNGQTSHWSTAANSGNGGFLTDDNLLNDGSRVAINTTIDTNYSLKVGGPVSATIFQGAFNSTDGTSGITGSPVGLNVKNGLIVGSTGIIPTSTREAYFPIISGLTPTANTDDTIPVPLPYDSDGSSITWTFKRLDFRTEISPSSGSADVNVKVNGVSILPTNISIASGSHSSTTNSFSVVTANSGDLLLASFGNVSGSDRWSIYVTLQGSTSQQTNTTTTVNSINGMFGNINLAVSGGLQIATTGQTITLTTASGSYVATTGGTVTGNLLFQPTNGGYGVRLFASSSDPAMTDIGAIYFNTTSKVLKVYDGSIWNSQTGTGTVTPSGVSGSGTTGTIPMWSGSTALSDSIMSQNGSNILVSGIIQANQKHFRIKHPSKKDYELIHSCLEGPENGVYYRGTSYIKNETKIMLPDYWSKLVGNDYTVYLTSQGKRNIYVGKQDEYGFEVKSGNFFRMFNKNMQFNFYVVGSRLDAPLEIEQKIVNTLP